MINEIKEVLWELKDKYFVTGIKAEFEAEGTRTEEAMRLKEIISKVGLDLTIKIGGCEAKKDIYEALDIGVKRIVAPMVETKYALSKYLNIVRDIKEDVKFLINIETMTAVANFSDMLELPSIDLLDGIVIGRVDLSGSMGLKREDINGRRIFEACKILLTKAKGYNLDTVIGGGVSTESMNLFKKLPDDMLDRYETRKVIFDARMSLNQYAHIPENGIKKALEFELLWLKYKRQYYNNIAMEDDIRIKMLEDRYRSSDN